MADRPTVHGVPAHVISTAVVFDDPRLLFVPVPKAGTTGVLWLLATAAGLSADRIHGSEKLEVTRDLTIHDLSVWGRQFTLAGRSARDVARILESRDWFRVTAVREPARRLWSAWVSKVLVRDPRFVAAYGSAEWFPPPPSSSHDVLEWFRRFVQTLSSRPADWHDSHWMPQADLVGVGSVSYAHVGRLEQLEETLVLLRSRLGVDDPVSRPVRNRSLLPFDPAVFDAAATAACAARLDRDRASFDYPPLAVSDGRPGSAWHAAVDASLPGIHAVIERNERVGDLHMLLKERR